MPIPPIIRYVQHTHGSIVKHSSTNGTGNDAMIEWRMCICVLNIFGCCEYGSRSHIAVVACDPATRSFAGMRVRCACVQCLQLYVQARSGQIIHEHMCCMHVFCTGREHVHTYSTYIFQSTTFFFLKKTHTFFFHRIIFAFQLELEHSLSRVASCARRRIARICVRPRWTFVSVRR